mmetsp:Transcript_85514/g.151328  ORF Transcript_85514/g.151328 Transcript_85514/m.151328 type:complete len:370 (+) Transcript_85514:64-1173(+)|eukprot:CAMPEP_0197634342 /NCGR_PEP_ID=MMETSP1338-20131121/10457_1 /TAXON_ID=43686 ORGANISM="Pelagodinium beii, Strain RCC1491" /NCGR_SAMPLE_ID=MMETSP1338 /ASSEMBLY_ACC=CAM_ASM_000754 /LENGTH=369 /DNA_ID=CAMNT_0043206187 /DNA_START=52 /DNA_END=1161 /DNA_ORIENTATION=-
MAALKDRTAISMLSLLCLAPCAAGLREQVNVQTEHGEGLEEEHSFQAISRGTRESSGSAWRVTSEDEKIMETLLTKLNPPGRDSDFTWRDDKDHWTFGLVQLTAQTAKGSLVLHMLHRHGLASLLASRAEDEGHVQTQATVVSLESYVQSAENQTEIRELRDLLMSLSLSGLRNLHSFDHQWSVDKFRGKVPGCSQQDAGGCILQAGTSKMAYDWLTGQGFGPRLNLQVEKGFQGLMNGFQSGASGLSMITYKKFLSPSHTGKKDLRRLELRQSGGKHVLAGHVFWEDGGISDNLLIDIPLSVAAAIKSADSETRNALIEAELQKYIEKLTHSHKSFMLNGRLKIWTHETAEFSEMYPKYAKAIRIRGH